MSTVVPTPTSRTVVLVACEASGDLLGASLITAMKASDPSLKFEGIGGEHMKAAGMALWHDYSALAVMGLVEVIAHLPRLLRLRKATIRRTLAIKPAAFIGIDGPDFNLGVERKLKAQGIKTVHYVSPSIWAWREARAKKIQRSADRVLCLFPMEPPIYARYQADARYVGHPLADQFALEPDQKAARLQLGIPTDARVLGLLPGSRISEIERLGATFLLAAIRLRRRNAYLRVVSPMANARCKQAMLALINQGIPKVEGDDTNPSLSEWLSLKEDIALTDGQPHTVMIASDQIILASGTAALEAMLAKRPMVVAYKVSPITAMIVRSLGLLKVNRYSLPNVLAGEPMVPELIQEQCTPAAIADTMLRLIENPTTSSELMPRFRAIHEQLKAGGATAAALAVMELIES